MIVSEFHLNLEYIFNIDQSKKKGINEEKQDDKQTLSIMGVPILQ